MQCPKCGGLGYIACYGHIAQGVCFKCNGRGVVASNGKPITSVKTTQLKYNLYGLNKRETKAVLDFALDGGGWTTTDSKTQASWDKCVALGHMVKINNAYSAAPWFTRKSIDILIDWSK